MGLACALHFIRMCLIFLSLNQHPTYKLIVAGNRDEFYERKTAAANYWKDHPEILGGRDLEAGGTWMAMTRSGKISMITNYRDLQNLKAKAPSRGQLVSDFLMGEREPENYLRQIVPHKNEFNGFNLIVGSADQLWYLSNYKDEVERIPPGIHGLSNALLDTPWPKVVRGKKKFVSVLEKATTVNPDILFTMLMDDHVAPDAQLPDTGVGLERERQLSSMFIKSPGYGSRCSTVVLIDQNNHVLFSERVYDLNTFEFKTGTFEFDIS
jgi:uncharacterized protein with NRDE domain